MPNAILFGSISTVADTSELQRKAFNQAFSQHGLDWNWPQKEYRKMLASSGGRQRIADYAQSHAQTVDAAAIHQTKTNLFQKFLSEETISPRPGVAHTIEQAKTDGMQIALVTTTSKENVSAMLSALSKSISDSSFDLVVDASKVSQPKPAKDAYCYAIEQLKQSASSCIAIEDNVDGITAAIAANLTCLAFPNQNTADHDLSTAHLKIDERLNFAPIKAQMEKAQMKSPTSSPT